MTSKGMRKPKDYLERRVLNWCNRVRWETSAALKPYALLQMGKGDGFDVIHNSIMRDHQLDAVKMTTNKYYTTYNGDTDKFDVPNYIWRFIEDVNVGERPHLLVKK